MQQNRLRPPICASSRSEDYAHESYTAKHGSKPLWQGKDFKALQTSLRSHSPESLPLERLKILWEHFAASTEPFTAKQGDSLAYFCANLREVFRTARFGQGRQALMGKAMQLVSPNRTCETLDSLVRMWLVALGEAYQFVISPTLAGVWISALEDVPPARTR